MSNSKVLKEEQVSNHPQAIATVIAGIKEELSMSNDCFIICAEHTGQYTYPLICACKSVGSKLWLENASQIKYCSGVTRGKMTKWTPAALPSMPCASSIKPSPTSVP